MAQLRGQLGRGVIGRDELAPFRCSSPYERFRLGGPTQNATGSLGRL
jgi:hypothetical protein